MFFLAVNIIKKNCVIGKQGFSLFPFFVLGIVPIFANDNYTLTFSYGTTAFPSAAVRPYSAAFFPPLYLIYPMAASIPKP